MLADFPRRVDARDAFSLRLVLLGLPLAVIGQLVYWEPGMSFGGLLAASLVGYVAFGAVLGCARLAATRAGATHPSSLAVAGVGALAGLARAGLSMGLWGAVGGGELGGTEVLARLMAACLLGASLVPIGGLLLGGLRSFRQDRERLRAELIQAEYSALMSDARGEALRELVNGEIATQVDRAIATVIGDLPDEQSDDFAEWAARRMRQAASDVERPDGTGSPTARKSSHRLSGHIDAWRAALRVNPLPTGVVVPLWISTAFPAQIANGTVTSATVVTSVGVAAIILTFTMARRAIARYPRLWAALSVAAVIGASVLASVAWALAFPNQNWQTFAVNVVVGTLWLGFLTLLMSVAMAAIYRGALVVDELGRQVSVAQARATASLAAEQELRRQAATMLHSDVQGRLYGAATYVEQPDFAATSTWVQDQLNALPRRLADANSGSMSDLLQEHFSRWSGILTIEHSFAAEPSDPLTRIRVVAIVDEALTNAFRHARARNVSVSIAPIESTWQVTVLNDGLPPAPKARHGLGLALLDETTRGNWSLEPKPEGNGAVLTANVM